MVDNEWMVVSALDEADSRRYEARVAGPAALVVAKLHKIGERASTAPGRLVDKDAHDIYRVLIHMPTEPLAADLRRLLSDAVPGDATVQAMTYLGGALRRRPRGGRFHDGWPYRGGSRRARDGCAPDFDPGVGPRPRRRERCSAFVAIVAQDEPVTLEPQEKSDRPNAIGGFVASARVVDAPKCHIGIRARVAALNDCRARVSPSATITDMAQPHRGSTLGLRVGSGPREGPRRWRGCARDTDRGEAQSEGC